ncbi:MAG: UvrD-helicase domain-containing protein [Myxococcota bacterium]|nr:UvrD-helicase domain-containing protein [Myxococcota bacterium]
MIDALNDEQREAVNHARGPLLLLAGAGSGKTRVVTTRIVRLLEDGVHPGEILALTFTNRAAREMKERVTELLGLNQEPPLLISTFHALGARLLRQHADLFDRSSGFSIYDEDDQVALLRGVLDTRGHRLKAHEIKRILRAFARAKNDGNHAKDAIAPPEFIGLDFDALGRGYEARLRHADAFDFGDLILRPMELVEHSDALRRRFQARWPWILVDEFQDTNIAQYRWLKGLAPEGSNLFVVGDDDQSIYGWRGADVTNILQFPEEYPSAKVIRLEQNYRSYGFILDAANGVIHHNRNRLGKSLWTARGEGPRVELDVLKDARDEAAYVARRIVQMCQRGEHSPRDVAILMRANHLSLDLEASLRTEGLAYRVLRGRAFFQRAEVRDALAYLRLLVNPNDVVAFGRAVQAPARGVGKKSIQVIEQAASSADQGIWMALVDISNRGALKGKARTGLSAFVEAIRVAMQAIEDTDSITDAVRGLFLRVGLLIEDESYTDSEQDASRADNIHRLLMDIDGWETKHPDGTLGDYLEEIKLVSDADDGDALADAVSLMTVHAAKGLEFPVVFVVGLEDGLFPHANAIRANEVEEERRLCYVAMTRAQNQLILTRAIQRSNFQETRRHPPSRFLNEIPHQTLHQRHAARRSTAELARVVKGPRTGEANDWYARPDLDGTEDEFRVGVHVWHAQFGAGRIQHIERGMRTVLTVKFSDMAPMKVVADYVSIYEG